ncbi:hypothetical protein UFOVP299_8 [uncultured Caudovirales phage]|uniref:Uncharacterized protein n=1 Tax=uncultured Caudovirales phage TaxID=2100421 RepID=A0A6J5LNE2_9CAUD|nr:hypothetical protein UFOVP299_8 [uncultured Caudovirales phage]
MSTLTIRKKSLKTWLHTDSVLGDFIISKFYFNADNVSFQIVEQGQSRRVIYNITDITLYALPTGGTPETFTTITELSLRLEELNYPAFQYDGQITSIANLIEAGTGVTITGDGTEASPYIISSGGSQSLAEVLLEGNITDGTDISISDGDKIVLDNGANLKKGTTDAGLGGTKGIALRCAVDYELKWEAGRLYVMGGDGFTIREVSHNFTTTPTVTDDDDKGFIVDSRWILDNGDVYVCTDDTTGAAVWELVNTGTTPTLQQVTDAGNETTNDIIVGKETGTSYIQIANNDNTLTFQVEGAFGSLIELNDANNNNYGSLTCGELLMTSGNSSENVQLNSNYISLQTASVKPYIQLGGSDGTLTGSVEIKTDLIDGNYTQQLPDKSGTFAMIDDIPAAGVTSVGLTMPSAFSVTNSPITSSGDIAVTGAGLVSQYVRGDGTLANFPSSSGGGSSLSFYLNGSVSKGTIGGIAFKEMDRTPILGSGTDFTINANGYIQSFITDLGLPNQLEIPAGNWNFETYFSASSGGGTPSFYVELYKWDGTTLSLIASNSATPEVITNGTAIDAYFSALAVPQTSLLATDRLAIRIYVNHSSKTIKLHTEDNHLCQVITTFSSGITALNGLTDQVQYFNVGTGATNFNISSSSNTHTFNLLFNIRRNANNSSNNNINYNGYAVTGSAELSAVWTITRLTIAASGSIIVATATNVAWTNRESATYI